jgi:two-component system, OmpR family, alkaline phosphatase synthesis response regulator PhoP
MMVQCRGGQAVAETSPFASIQGHGPGRVLLVIDQGVLAKVVTLALNHGDLLTRAATGVTEAMTALGEWQPHLAIIDMDIEQGKLMNELREAAPHARRLPVIALTRRGDLKRKLAAFELGVDDILTVPFSPEELVARTLVVMRRTSSVGIAFTPKIRVGGLEIDILNRRVQAETADPHLTTLEQSLLYLLVANAGLLMSREEILDTLWGTDYVADTNLVDRYIRTLRAKLQDDWRHPRYISTVPGQGYRFVPTRADEKGESGNS